MITADYAMTEQIFREAARMQNQVATWHRQTEQTLREAARIQDQVAVWHRQKDREQMAMWRLRQKETRTSGVMGVPLPPSMRWSWVSRAPTQAISNEIQLPTRRRIGFSPWHEDR